jgi:hypothetical protein
LCSGTESLQDIGGEQQVSPLGHDVGLERNRPEQPGHLSRRQVYGNHGQPEDDDVRQVKTGCPAAMEIVPL